MTTLISNSSQDAGYFIEFFGKYLSKLNSLRYVHAHICAHACMRACVLFYMFRRMEVLWMEECRNCLPLLSHWPENQSLTVTTSKYKWCFPFYSISHHICDCQCKYEMYVHMYQWLQWFHAYLHYTHTVVRIVDKNWKKILNFTEQQIDDLLVPSHRQIKSNFNWKLFASLCDVYARAWRRLSTQWRHN